MSDRREWTAERHAAAWDRCNRATSGPWKWWTSNSHRRLTAEDRQDGGVAYGTKHKDGCGDIVIGEHDMAFIEEARVDLPDALRENERLTDALACDRAILKARTDALDTAETCRESLRKGLEQASEQIAEMTAEAKVATAEIEQLRDTVHNYKALLAAAESAGREVCDERDLMRAGRRRAAQTLIAEIGAAGPEDIEETAKRAVKEIRRLKADLLLLGALKSSEVAPVIERFAAAFGADVSQAPSGKRTTAEAERDAWERLRSAATAAVEAYENSDADEAFEPVFESLDDALAGLATFEEESGDEPFAAAAPVRHARHDRHCMIHDGVGCSREPGCEVDG